MSDRNFFGLDKMPKWTENVRMLTIISNTVTQHTHYVMVSSTVHGAILVEYIPVGESQGHGVELTGGQPRDQTGGLGTNTSHQL